MKNLKLSLIVFLLGLEVLAMESIGRVVKVHGDVKRHQDGSSVVLKRGDHLHVGSSIVSGPRSFVKIFMKDDTIFQLGPNSEFALEKFDFKTKSERTAVYNLAKGKLRSLFTVKAKERSLKIKTPTASMGVRGTEILSDVYKIKGKLTTDIALLSGSLEVQTKGIQKKMMIKPGFVYQSSFSDSIKKQVINSKIKRMDKRVFVRARRAKGSENVFLHDVRRSVDKKMVKDVKFDVKESNVAPPKRLPANKDIKKMEYKDNKDIDAKNTKPMSAPTIKVKPPVVAPVNKIKTSSRDVKSKINSSAIKEAFIKDMMKKRAIEIEQKRIPASDVPPPPPPKTYPADGSLDSNQLVK
jgi:hypothetical protein